MNMVTTSSWFRPLAFWFLSLSLAPLMAGVFLGLLGWTLNDLTSQLWLFGTLGQTLMDLTALGLWAVWKMDGDRPSTAVHLRSALIGIGLATLIAGLRFTILGHLMEGRFMGGVPAFTQAWDLSGPGNLFAAAAALLAYGPGEALLVLTWIKAWDRVWGLSARVLSPGVATAAVLWALPHLMNLPMLGPSALVNTGVMVGVGLVFGVLAKGTKSPWGPVLFWTLCNGTSL